MAYYIWEYGDRIRYLLQRDRPIFSVPTRCLQELNAG
eukprot:gene48779-29296_t